MAEIRLGVAGVAAAAQEPQPLPEGVQHVRLWREGGAQCGGGVTTPAQEPRRRDVKGGGAAAPLVQEPLLGEPFAAFHAAASRRIDGDRVVVAGQGQVHRAAANNNKNAAVTFRLDRCCCDSSCCCC
jgi:hypothetical protein